MDRVIKVNRGIKGDHGVSITEVKLNDDGHFIVHYDNGEIVDAGLSAFGTAKIFSDNAKKSAEAAKISENNAKTSEENAATSASNSANSAVSSEASSQESTRQASISANGANTATGKAKEASESATSAASSAASSANSAKVATDCKDYISSHYEEIKSNIATTETQLNSAKSFCDQTDAHMKAVEADMKSAQESATTASSKASEASSSATSSSQSATSAASSAASASTSATAAATSETNAAKHEKDAEDLMKNTKLTEDNLADSVKAKLLGEGNVDTSNLKDKSVTMEKLAFEISSGGSVSTLPWANITGKPDTFTPSAHTHKLADITDLDLSTKQDKLTFDTAPTADSTNPVTSGGVKKAIDEKTTDLSNYYTKTETDSKIAAAIAALTSADTKSY